MERHIRAVTLLELTVAISFLAIIVLGVNSIYYFSHSRYASIDRTASLDNEVGLLIDHMRKEMALAIGNETLFGADTVIKTTSISGDNAIWFCVDSSGNCQSNAADWAAYRFRGSPNYQIWFCPQCLNASCRRCVDAWGTVANDTIASNISSFSLQPAKPAGTLLTNNYVTVRISSCWNPSQAPGVDNPCITKDTLIGMPSVSIN